VESVAVVEEVRSAGVDIFGEQFGLELADFSTFVEEDERKSGLLLALEDVGEVEAGCVEARVGFGGGPAVGHLGSRLVSVGDYEQDVGLVSQGQEEHLCCLLRTVRVDQKGSIGQQCLPHFLQHSSILDYTWFTLVAEETKSSANLCTIEKRMVASASRSCLNLTKAHSEMKQTRRLRNLAMLPFMLSLTALRDHCRD
jgi:hypothetical protein